MIQGQTEEATECFLLSGKWSILNCLLKTTSLLGKCQTSLLVDMSSPYDSQFSPNLPNTQPGSCGQLVAMQHLNESMSTSRVCELFLHTVYMLRHSSHTGLHEKVSVKEAALRRQW